MCAAPLIAPPWWPSPSWPRRRRSSPAAGAVFTEGRNRFGFGIFTVDQQQITDADVAIYAAPAPDNEPVQGPFPARIESLETEPEFTARSTADDPDAAKVVYVTDLVLDR